MKNRYQKIEWDKISPLLCHVSCREAEVLTRLIRDRVLSINCCHEFSVGAGGLATIATKGLAKIAIELLGAKKK